MNPKQMSISWTAEQVEARLIEAFRALPSTPVYGGGRRGVAPALGGRSPNAEALSWAPRHVADNRDRLYLLTWARCRATGASFAEVCRGSGWPRASAEDGRRRAAAAIAAGLGRDPTPG